MRGLLTTQSQNGYREQIHKETLTRLAWKTRYGRLYPSCGGTSRTTPLEPEPQVEPRLEPAQTQTATVRTAERRSAPLPPPSPPLPAEEQQTTAPPLMRPASPQTKQALYQDSSHHGRGRQQYLQRRGHMKPEEKFDFPVVSSWEYGWRLGDFTLNYKTPSSAKSSVVRNTFYAKNGVFTSPNGTNQLG